MHSNSRTPEVQKPPQNMVRDEDRTITDKKYKIVFYVVLTVWLASCICVFACKNITELDQQNEFEQEDELIIIEEIEEPNEINYKRIAFTLLIYMGNIFDIDTYYKEFGPTFIWQKILVCSALIIVSGITLIWIATTRSPALIVLMCSALTIFSLNYHTAKFFFNDCEEWEPILLKLIGWIGPEAALVPISSFVLLIVTRYGGVTRTETRIKKVFRYYSTCCYVVLAGFLACLMIILLSIFTGIVLESITYTNMDSNMMYWIIYSGSVYMIVLTYTLSKMIISATAARYFWDKESEQSPFKTMCQIIIAIFKFHFGSACGIAICPSFLHTIILGYIIGFTFTEFKLARYCYIFCILQLFNIDYISVFISMYSLGISQAFTRFWILIWKIHLLFVPSCLLIWVGAFFIILPTNCMMLLYKWGVNQYDPMFSALSCLCYIEMLFIFLPVCLVIGIIEDTRYICIISKVEQEAMVIDEESTLQERKIHEKSQVFVEKPRQIISQIIVTTDL